MITLQFSQGKWRQPLRNFYYLNLKSSKEALLFLVRRHQLIERLETYLDKLKDLADLSDQLLLDRCIKADPTLANCSLEQVPQLRNELTKRRSRYSVRLSKVLVAQYRKGP